MSVLVSLPQALAVGHELQGRGITRVHALWANFPATFGWIIARGFKTPFSYSGHAWDVYVGGRLLKEKTELEKLAERFGPPPKALPLVQLPMGDE